MEQDRANSPDNMILSEDYQISRKALRERYPHLDGLKHSIKEYRKVLEKYISQGFTTGDDFKQHSRKYTQSCNIMEAVASLVNHLNEVRLERQKLKLKTADYYYIEEVLEGEGATMLLE